MMTKPMTTPQSTKSPKRSSIALKAVWFTRTVCLAMILLILAFATAVLCDLNPYATLEVDTRASSSEIKKKFHSLAKKHHPDKGGDTKKFQDIQLAYEVLSDDKKRRIYDRTKSIKKAQGEEPNQPSGFPFDLFFGGQGGGGGFGRDEQRKNKKADTVVPLYLSLEDLYNGAEIDINIQKQITCKSCRGSGGHGHDGVQICDVCSGKGFRTVQQMIGPGMYTMAQRHCNKCSGKGEIVKKRCPVCHAAKVVSEVESVHLEIRPGSRDGDRHEISSAGDSAPDYDPGSIVFEIKEFPNGQGHPEFVREGHSLHITIIISLKEALFGFSRDIKHLDGRILSHGRKQITQPSQVIMIENEGMPTKDGDSHGHLFIKHKVLMPTKLSKEKLEALRKVFDS